MLSHQGTARQPIHGVLSEARGVARAIRASPYVERLVEVYLSDGSFDQILNTFPSSSFTCCFIGLSVKHTNRLLDFSKMKSIILAAFASLAVSVTAQGSTPLTARSVLPPRVRIAGRSRLEDASAALRGETSLAKRQLPAKPTNVKKLTSPNGSGIRYKELTGKGICETTPGVRSFSGYIDLNSTVHIYFMFFHSRGNPSKDPFTLWLNGGPGSDSLIGMFEGKLGPSRADPPADFRVHRTWTVPHHRGLEGRQ